MSAACCCAAWRRRKPSLADDRISLKPGDPLSQQSIAASQQKLYDLGIFSKVQTAIQNPGGDEDRKYVLFQVDEASRYSFTLGVGAQLARIGGGVTTLDNPAGSTGFAPRVSVGISRLNLFGLGQTLSLNTLVSTIEQRAILTYLLPQFMGQRKPFADGFRPVRQRVRHPHVSAAAAPKGRCSWRSGFRGNISCNIDSRCATWRFPI